MEAAHRKVHSSVERNISVIVMITVGESNKFIKKQDKVKLIRAYGECLGAKS